MRWIVLAIAVGLAGCAESAPPQDVADDESPPPAISFQKDATNARLRIVMADQDADWHDLRVYLDGCRATLHAGTTHSVPDDGPAAPSPKPVVAGHHLQFQGQGTCSVSVTYLPTNALYDTWLFSL